MIGDGSRLSVRRTKCQVINMARAIGISDVVGSSRWRRSRVLVLGFHGISRNDEHEWNPGLYITPSQFQARLHHIRSRGCSVLPLDEAIRRLYAGTLPDRSVAITFDDGFADFQTHAWPLLKEFSYPATVYLSTYYSDNHQWPVFNLMCSHLLWKCRSKRLEWAGILPEVIDLSSRPHRVAVERVIHAHCLAHHYSGAEKNELLSELARRLGFDLRSISDAGVLHLMSAGAVRQVASEGADVQLHTHRHRSFRSREEYQKDITDNIARISLMTGEKACAFLLSKRILARSLSRMVTAARDRLRRDFRSWHCIPSVEPLAAAAVARYEGIARGRVRCVAHGHPWLVAEAGCSSR